MSITGASSLLSRDQYSIEEGVGALGVGARMDFQCNSQVEPGAAEEASAAVTGPLEQTSILHGDASDILKRIPDNSVQLCLTSPPYNIGKSYEKEFERDLVEYRVWLEDICQKLSSKIKPGGSLCFQVGNHIHKGVLNPLDYIAFGIFSGLGLTLRNRIVWRYNFGLNAKSRLSGRYEVLLWFTKGDEYKFNLDPIRVKQLYPGKRHSSKKGDLAGKPSGNPKGKNPSDFWEFDPQTAFFGEPVWNIPNVKSKHPEKTDHPCQFPSELADRCILAFTDEGDVVLDPFLGTGTTLICADLRGRVGIGIELHEEYALSAEERLAKARAGKLPLRAAGKPPRDPRATETVAQVPMEWMQGGEG
jgi:adenine-specific DNA-methyltransferase